MNGLAWMDIPHQAYFQQEGALSPYSTRKQLVLSHAKRNQKESDRQTDCETSVMTFEKRDFPLLL
jgi:hypothetical protein